MLPAPGVTRRGCGALVLGRRELPALHLFPPRKASVRGRICSQTPSASFCYRVVLSGSLLTPRHLRNIQARGCPDPACTDTSLAVPDGSRACVPESCRGRHCPARPEHRRSRQRPPFHESCQPQTETGVSSSQCSLLTWKGPAPSTGLMYDKLSPPGTGHRSHGVRGTPAHGLASGLVCPTLGSQAQCSPTPNISAGTAGNARQGEPPWFPGPHGVSEDRYWGGTFPHSSKPVLPKNLLGPSGKSQHGQGSV